MSNAGQVRTYFEGAWHDGDLRVMGAADHGAWLGTTVFDGARYVDGVAPDLEAHCARVNRSAEALGIVPSKTTKEIVAIAWEGLRSFAPSAAVYIRPMYWGIDYGHLLIVPGDAPAGFALCLQEVPMAPPGTSARLTTTRFRRPVLEDAVVNAKAGCLYPNNARMLREALSRGYQNALVADAMGNVAETASANIFMVRDGEVFTPIPNGTFLAGITRARHIENMCAAGMTVHETVLTFDDFRTADEVFMSGNLMKVTGVSEFDGTLYRGSAVTERVREMYWDWALSERP